MSLLSFNGKRFAALLRQDYGKKRISYCFFLLGLKIKPARILGRLCILALPVILVRSVASLMTVYPWTMEIAMLWLSVWHVFFLTVTVLCWYATYQRLAQIDLEYNSLSNFKDE